MTGDFEWAVQELSDDLGSRWTNDEFGHILLHMSLYEKDSQGRSHLSPDLQHGAYQGYLDYMTSKYGYDFEDNFDWDAYQRWYG